MRVVFCHSERHQARRAAPPGLPERAQRRSGRFGPPPPSNSMIVAGGLSWLRASDERPPECVPDSGAPGEHESAPHRALCRAFARRVGPAIPVVAAMTTSVFFARPRRSVHQPPDVSSTYYAIAIRVRWSAVATRKLVGARSAVRVVHIEIVGGIVRRITVDQSGFLADQWRACVFLWRRRAPEPPRPDQQRRSQPRSTRRPGSVVWVEIDSTNSRPYSVRTNISLAE